MGQRTDGCHAEGGATPFEADITDAVGKGENLLALRVREHTPTSDKSGQDEHYADFPLAGIMRPVYLFRVPEVHVGAVEVSTAFDKEYRDATMQVRAVVWNESATAFRGSVEMALAGPLPGSETVAKAASRDSRNRPLATYRGGSSLPRDSAADVDRRSVHTSTAFGATAPRQAGCGGLHPSHRLAPNRNSRHGSVDQRPAGEVPRHMPPRFPSAAGSGRDRRIGAAGLAAHERGQSQRRADFALSAAAGSLLEIADELGMYVEGEASFCWTEPPNDLRYTPRIIQLTAEMLARDRNHPSVAYWSLCNESEFGYGFRAKPRMGAAGGPQPADQRRLPSTIGWKSPPCTTRFGPSHRQAKEICGSRCCSMKAWPSSKASGCDVGEMWVDPGQRDYYAQPLPAVFDRFMQSQVDQGSYIWCWGDDIFCVPGRGLEYGRNTTRCHFVENSYQVAGRGLVGDAPWGVVDGWRRGKPEFWITKKLDSPVKVKELPLPLPALGGPIRVPVENQYDFRNLAELKIRWALGEQNGTAQLQRAAAFQGHASRFSPAVRSRTAKSCS